MSTEHNRAQLPAPPLTTVWPPLKLEEHPIDEFPSIRVIVVGAGVSGITAGILLPAKVPNIDLVIYERQNDLVSFRTTAVKRPRTGKGTSYRKPKH